MLLEMRDAGFARGASVVDPRTLIVGEGEWSAQACRDADEAAALAMMAAGLVKASTGRVFVGAFDPTIQPVQVKRIVGYVPHEAVPNEFDSPARYVEYRCALWGLDPARAAARARALWAQLEGVHEAFAFPLVGALLAEPRLLVLDRPQPAFAPQIAAAAGAAAVFSTHVSAERAAQFSHQAAIQA